MELGKNKKEFLGVFLFLRERRLGGLLSGECACVTDGKALGAGGYG